MERYIENVEDSEPVCETFIEIIKGKDTYKKLLKSESERNKERVRIRSLKRKGWLEIKKRKMTPTDKIKNEILEKLKNELLLDVDEGTKLIWKTLGKNDFAKNYVFYFLRYHSNTIFKKANSRKTIRALINYFWDFVIEEPIPKINSKVSEKKDFYKLLKGIIVIRISVLKHNYVLVKDKLKEFRKTKAEKEAEKKLTLAKFIRMIPKTKNKGGLLKKCAQI